MEEVWKPVKGYEEYYEVSNLGRVRSLDRVIVKPHPKTGVLMEYRHKGRIMKPSKVGVGVGYLSVVLSRNKADHKTSSIHRMVASAFIPNPYNFKTVNHKDENPLNNKVDNLEWCTYSYNLQYNGRAKRVGIVQGKDVEQWTLDGKLVATYYSIRHAEAATGIKCQTICRCCKKKYGAKTAGGYRWKYKQ